VREKDKCVFVLPLMRLPQMGNAPHQSYPSDLIDGDWKSEQPLLSQLKDVGYSVEVALSLSQKPLYDRETSRKIYTTLLLKHIHYRDYQRILIILVRLLRIPRQD
jgi:hypothetical protein